MPVVTSDKDAGCLQARMLVAVFSYNRPALLANCLQSLRDMCPGSDVVIYDDRSTHPDLPRVFCHFGHPVVTGAGGNGRHGGLYFNMEQAYQRALAGAYDHILMLQDDQQLLRPLGLDLFAEYLGYFDRYPDATQVDIRFARTPVTLFELCDDARAYRQVNPAYRGYNDVGLFHLGRLRAVDWSFAIHSGFATAGEAKKAAEALAKGMRAVVAYTPALTHVPFIKVYRNRVRWPRLDNKGKAARRHAYLTPEDIARIDARPPEEAPGREKYLSFAEPIEDAMEAILGS